MDHADPSSPVPLIEPPTWRESDMLRLMADDFSNREMADRLVLSPFTVKRTTQQTYGKPGFHEPVQRRRPAITALLLEEMAWIRILTSESRIDQGVFNGDA